MTRTVIFVAVLLMLAPSEIKERATDLRRKSAEMRERFWRKYDDAANRAIDQLEALGVVRTKDYGTNKS
jgi:hypothetical protein